MEHYYTIQGEGYNTGKPCYFLRLGGCDVGCVWCDVKDSWEGGRHPLKSIDEMVSEIKKYPGSLGVITGGEPLMHNLDTWTQQLKEAGFSTHMETSGSSPLSGQWDWI